MGAERVSHLGGDAPLFAAGVRLIADRGMEAFTLDDLAGRAGLELDEVLARWSNPAQAIADCMRWDESRFLVEVHERTGAAPPEVRLRALVEACVTQFDWTLWIELWSMALRERWAAELRAELESAFRAELAGLIREGQETGVFGAVGPERAAAILSSLLDGFATQATLGDSYVSAQYMHRACLWTADRMLSSNLGREIGG
jgi:AcrR family transcriptional regulator